MTLRSHLALGSSQGKRMHKHYVCQRRPGTSPAFAKCLVNEVLINLLCRELMCYKVAKLQYIYVYGSLDPSQPE